MTSVSIEMQTKHKDSFLQIYKISSVRTSRMIRN